MGIDLVGMNVNDILCSGAKPLFFWIISPPASWISGYWWMWLKGLPRAVVRPDVLWWGGETAEMPGFYKKGEYDLAGFCVGVVDRQEVINGSRIKAGDILIGIESNGLHSNGYSLVRKVFNKRNC